MCGSVILCVMFEYRSTGIVVQSLLSFQVLSVEENRDISIRPLVPVGH